MGQWVHHKATVLKLHLHAKDVWATNSCAYIITYYFATVAWHFMYMLNMKLCFVIVPADDSWVHNLNNSWSFCLAPTFTVASVKFEFLVDVLFKIVHLCIATNSEMNNVQIIHV